LLLLLPLSGQSAAPEAPAPAPTPATIEPRRLVVEDGQLISHSFTVFVTYPITATMDPILRFTGSHLVTKPSSLETQPIKPQIVAEHQHRVITVNDVPLTVEGTLLMFDLSGHRIEFYKSAIRLLPMISWTEPASTAGQPPVVHQVVAESELYLGNMFGAVLWTLLTVGLILVLLLRWSVVKAPQITVFKPRPALLLVTGSDGFLSLWRTQLILWTIAVGAVVFLFGLLRLRVPEIPESLVALMGMSLLTGGLSAAKAKKDSPATPATPVIPATPTPLPTPIAWANPNEAKFADLISAWNAKIGRVELSVPKAQMVFWTVIVLFLFLVKSILLGALWPVPWEMVALTGMSQAGYIGDKFIQSST